MKLILQDKPIEVALVSTCTDLHPPYQTFYTKTSLTFPKIYTDNRVLIGCVDWNGDIYISPLYMKIAKFLGRPTAPYPWFLYSTVVHELLHRLVHKTAAHAKFAMLVHKIAHYTGGWLL